MEELLNLALFMVFTLFVTYSCNQSKKISDFKTDDSIIKTEVIVQLKEKTSSRQILEKFKHQELEVLKIINKDMNILLFTYNTKLISSEKIIEKLKNSPLVKEVEFNKTLKSRR